MARILIVRRFAGRPDGRRCLLRDGHEVQVLERSPRSLEGRGAGIVTHDNLRLALRRAARWSTTRWACRCVARGAGRRRKACAAGTIRRCSRPGAACTRCCAPRCRPGATGWARRQPGRPRTEHRRHGATLASGERLSGRPADRRRRHPLGRARAAGAGGAAAYAGYIAWRGVCDEAGAVAPHPRHAVRPLRLRPARRRTDDRLPGGRCRRQHRARASGAGTSSGTGRCPPGADLAALMTDADGVHHPEGIAPQQVSWRLHRGDATGRARRLAPQYAEIVEKTADALPAADLRPGLTRGSPSAAWRCWATPPSSRGRTWAWA
jgi:hypothetical protein